MAGIARTKRVTDPLDEKVKARIVGRPVHNYISSSSGSDHSGLSDLLFLEDNEESQSLHGSESDNDQFNIDPIEEINELVRSTLVDMKADPFRNMLEARVFKALEVFSCVRSNKSFHRRNVMAFLRDFGYNAAVCKTKWESSGGLTAGNYEFIDVTIKQTRYIIELDFVAEFEIARQTDNYERLLQTLPKVFIGKGEDLKRIVRVVSDAAKRSLKTRGLHLPPWRKNRFMQNKWFGPYRRTVNLVPANSTTGKTSYVVECRSVGFDAVNGLSLFHAATRTR